jgi:hypothetical protein
MASAAAAGILGITGDILAPSAADASACTNACASWMSGCLNWCSKNDPTPSCNYACNRLLAECFQCCNAGGSPEVCPQKPAPDTYSNPLFIPSLVLLPGAGVLAFSEKALLLMQTDGNLVIYDEARRARWASNTVGEGGFAMFQQDGNFVVYSPANSPVWASNTCCWGGNYLSVQNDGNVVVYTSFGLALWATGTNH